MKLLTKSIERKLKANAISGVKFGTDHKPVVKFFGGGACTWLISEMHPDTNRMYGLCDLGHGSAELGYVMLEDLEGLTFQFGLKVERDLWFKADKTLNEYADEARIAGRIAA